MEAPDRGKRYAWDLEDAMTMTEQSAESAREDTACCGHHDSHSRPGSGADAPETPRERVNRRWNEILQETRVTQTGVQILFGFLLSVAFTPMFRELETLDRGIYVTTVVLGAAATGSLIAPVSIHRFLSGQRMKDEVVETAGRLMMCGMVLLALTIGCTLLLILRFVVPGVLAEVLVGGVMLWFGLCWYALPLRLRRRAARRARADDA
jgi:fatty acid desaturase